VVLPVEGQGLRFRNDVRAAELRRIRPLEARGQPWHFTRDLRMEAARGAVLARLFASIPAGQKSKSRRTISSLGIGKPIWKCPLYGGTLPLRDRNFLIRWEGPPLPAGSAGRGISTRRIRQNGGWP
jgi:hypothetical protein